MVPDNSTGISRVPAYSGGVPVPFRFGYGALTLSDPAFQPVPLASWQPLNAPITPARASTPPVWALPRSLAATGGIVITFSSCRY